MTSWQRLLALGLVGAIGAVGPSPRAGGEGDEDASSDLVEYVDVNVSSLPSSNTIATKLSVPLQLTPASVGVVTSPLFTEQDALVLGDALQNVSGLNIQSGGGVHDYFAIRGFDSVSSSLVMTDGVSEPEVTFYNLYNVEGVEVFKGPAGFLYGKNPLAGAVNVVRKQPLPTNFTDFRGSFGSYGAAEAGIDWNASRSDGALNFRVNGFWQESDGYRDDMESDHVGVNPALTWNFGESSSLNFNYEYSEAEFSPDSGIPLYASVPGASLEIPGVDRRTSYQSAGDFSDQTLNRFQVDFETEISDRVRLRNKTYYRDLDWQSDGTLLSEQQIPGTAQAVRDLAVLDDHQQFIGNQLEWTVSLDGGSVRHELLLGLETIYETDEYTFGVKPLADVELFDPGTEAAVDQGTPVDLNSLGDVRNVVIAPYVIDQIEFSRRYQLMIGARYDRIDSEGDVRALNFLPGPATSYDRDDSEVSPILGFVFSPDPTLSLYVNASQSYAPPSTRLVNEQDPEDREPERGRQAELGAKKQFLDGRVRTTISVYQLERDNIAIVGPDGFTQQSGDQRSRGIELELAAEPLPRLRTMFAYAYNDAELTDFRPCLRDSPVSCVVVNYSGNTPIMAPRHVANAWVSKTFSNGIGVAAGARFIDGQYVAEDNRFKLDSALVLSGALFYDVKDWRFRLNFKNLTDAEYEMRGVAGGASVIPANPFTVYATVEFRM